MRQTYCLLILILLIPFAACKKDEEPESESSFASEMNPSSVAADERPQVPMTVSTRQILDLTTVEGSGSPEERAAQTRRLLGATWNFDASGGFSYSAPDSRGDLYPAYGTYSWTGNTLNFSVNQNSRDGFNAATSLSGTIDFSVSPALLKMVHISTMASGSTINGEFIGRAQGETYRTTIEVTVQ